MTDPLELQRFPARLGCALHGLGILILGSANARIHLLATMLVVGLGLWLRLGLSEWLWIVGAIGMVWTAEAFNSALEVLADRVSAERDPLIGRAKDLAAGAVLAAAIVAASIGLLIFVPAFIALTGH
ncbi:MAG: diacylglycerol kinase family protein [Gammaproteobacteria bacterium]